MLTTLGQQLAATLENQINAGKWRVGDRLPPERAMAAEHGVSRSTVREALDDLERAGLIERRQGSGTYIAPRRIEQSLLGHFSIVESLRSSGIVVGTELLGRVVGAASVSIADELSIDEGDPIVVLERLRFADEEPFMLERNRIPLAAFPGLDQVDLSTRSLYEVLRSEYGVVLERALESLEPVLLRADEAEMLRHDPGAPALLLLRTTFDAGDRPVESARAVVRSDRVRTLVERKVHEPIRY